MVPPVYLALYIAYKLFDYYQKNGTFFDRGVQVHASPNNKNQRDEDSIKFTCILFLANLSRHASVEERKYIETIIPKYLTQTKSGRLKEKIIIDKILKKRMPLSFYLNIYHKRFNKSLTELEDFIKILMYFTFISDNAVQKKIKVLENAIHELNISPNLFDVAFQDWLRSQKTLLTTPHYGSGVVFSDEGLVLTAFHIVKNTKTITIKSGNALFSANIIASDPDLDLSILAIHANLPPLPFSGSPIKLGLDVIALSFPKPEEYGYSFKSTKGTINALSGYQDHNNYYQIDTIVDRGSSGGPLIDEKTGSVIGLLAQQHVKNMKCGYAIKREIILKFLKDKIGFVSHSIISTNNGLNREAIIESASRSTVQIITFS